MAREEGVTAVEFAVIAPVFTLLMFGILEFATIMFAMVMLEGATSSSARMGKTGYVAEGMSRQEYIHQIVNDEGAPLLDADKLVITTKVYGQFNQINLPEPLTHDYNGNGSYDPGDDYNDINGNGQWDSDMATAGLGGAGDVVVYTVTYPWKVMTPMISDIIGDENGEYQLRSKVVVRNEPYDEINLGI